MRVFGRNLRLAGSTPRLIVNNVEATIDLARSDEHMLVATVPATLLASRAAVIAVDNGNGTGVATLDRTVTVARAAGTDPFGLGVSWAAGFAPIAAHVVNAATDVRLRDRARQMYFTGNRHMAVVGSDLLQTIGIDGQGPYTFEDTIGLVFEGNDSRWATGAPTFGRVHDGVIAGNRFTRDAIVQTAPGSVHSMTLDFAYRMAVVGNTFDVLGGPVANRARNDGETILTEGGSSARTENLGSVKGATATTLSDASNTLNTDPFGTGSLPENYGVAIVAGKGAGQTRRVTAYVLVARNAISNTTGDWISYVNSTFVNMDARAFGIATLGVEMRDNRLVANAPNLYQSSGQEEYANNEGFGNLMRIESFAAPHESQSLPRMLGTLLTGNSCEHCDVFLRTGTGAGGTTLAGNTRLDARQMLNDDTYAATQERSTDTVVAP